jgi:hypothetical protein
MHTIHNARVTLLATAFNTFGVGAIITGIVSPVVSGRVSDIAHIAAWAIFGCYSIATAQILLGRLRP